MRILPSLLSSAGLAMALLSTPLLRGPEARADSAWPYVVSRVGDELPALGRLVRFGSVSDAAPVATISQKDKQFAPEEVEVRVGQTIEILNDDTTVHNAYCQAPALKYNAGPQQPGTSSKVTFAAAGVFEIRCAIHPKMKLTVKVVE